MAQITAFEDAPPLDHLPVRYRIVDPYSDTGKPTVEYWYVVKKTPQGAWVAQAWSLSRHTEAMQYSGIEYQWLQMFGARASLEWMNLGRDELQRRGCKFVLDGDGKCFAHETLEWARYSYGKRKRAQIRHARRSIARAENGLHWLDTGRSQDEEERLAERRLFGVPPAWK